MTYLLVNCGHTHRTVAEGKACLAGTLAPKLYSRPVVPYRDQPGTMTDQQERYLMRLGATYRQLVNAHGARLSINEASRLIDALKKGTGSVTVETPPDPRLAFLKALITDVPEGYYAVQKAEGEKVHFLRISRPKKNMYAGAVKIQSVHGSVGTARLEIEAVLWPSGRWQVHSQYVIEPMMLLVADPTGANMLYAKKIGRCCRCNAVLTDERSRHYGIGPECEGHWPHIIQRVDEETALAQA